MKSNSSFNEKYIVYTTGNKINSYDGSNLTGLKFTQLTDIGTPSGNKFLITNQNGNGIDYIDMKLNAIKEINITNQNTNNIIWNEDICIVEHNMNGYVFIQLYDDNGDEIPILKKHIDNNHISFYLEKKPDNNKSYKMICITGGYSLNDIDISNNLILSSCSNLGFFIDGTNLAFSWTDPDDIELNGAVLAQWGKTVLVRKEGAYPSNHLDGTIMATTSRVNENKNYYRDNSFIDNTVEQGKTYYYMLFSQTVSGPWNNLVANRYTDGIGLSWQQVSEFVKAGRGAQLFPVGTTFIVEHPEYTTSTNIPGIAFTVLGHDQVPASDETISHTMCLGMSEILFNAQYDVGELTYAVTDDTNTKVGKTYYTHDGSEYTALIEGTDYQIGDSIPIATYYEKNLNNREIGSNNFAESNLLQWANSDGNANSWFEKQNIFDVCGSVLNGKNGFLNYIDQVFLSVVKDAKLITAKCKEEGGGSSIVNAKFWPLSRTQVFGDSNNGFSENERLTYFESNSAIKMFNSVASTWWLRSPYVAITYDVHYVSTSNTLANGYTGNNRGVSLACIIG